MEFDDLIPSVELGGAKRAVVGRRDVNRLPHGREVAWPHWREREAPIGPEPRDDELARYDGGEGMRQW